MDQRDQNPSELDLSELAEAARRAGSIVNEQIDTIVAAAERQADEIRREAERDAEETRRDAVSSANRVFEQIAALERPLAELVGTLRLEAGGVQRELEGQVDAEAVALPAESESLAEDAGEKTTSEPGADTPEPSADTAGDVPEKPAPEEAEPAREETGRPAEVTQLRPRPTPAVRAAPPEKEPSPSDVEAPEEPVSAELAPDPPPTSDPVPDEEPEAKPRKEPKMHEPPAPFTVAESDEPRKRKLFSRLRPGGSKKPFIQVPGHCAVCHKSFQAGDEESLRQSGWKVNDDVGLCPEDQAAGWQLPEGARLPFRRGGG